MTAIDSTSFAAPPTGHLGLIGRIGKLALPLMIGSLAAAGLQVVKAGILTHHGADAALYKLSMVQPAFIFMLAFLESVAIANQVFSSKSVTNWAKGDVLRATRVFSVVGVVLTGILAAGFWGASFAVGGIWTAGPELLPMMGLFVLALAPYLLFELRNGALRGQGRTSIALAPFAVLIAADLAITWIAVTRLDMGFYGVVLGMAAGPLIALPLVSWLLRREIGDALRGAGSEFKRHMFAMTIGVAGPVFVSMFAGSASAVVIFPMLAALGEDVASAFLVIVRVRILFIIPAIAVGSAIAILINQLPEAGYASEKRGILSVGVIAVLSVYAAATVGVWVLRPEVIGLVVPAGNEALFAATHAQMSVLIATFFLIAGFTMLQVILEHLGLGVRVLIVTVVLEIATVAAVFWVRAAGFGLDGMLQVMNAVAAASFLGLGFVFLGLLRKIGRSDAV